MPAENPSQHDLDPSDMSFLPMPDDDAEETVIGRSPDTPAGATSSTAGDSQDALDSAIAALAVRRGFALEEEIASARRLYDRSLADQSLGDTLVAQHVLTPRQLQRLRADVEAERTGQRIPGYAMLGKIGTGASATVFKARQTSLNRLVAIKVLPRRYSSHQDFIDRFYAEGRAAARLNHTGIVQAYDVGHADECHYFVMEYVEGDTVYELIQEKGTVNEERALEITIELAEALAHAHHAGLIHRDVKPRNIIITKTGQPKLADLGLARALADAEQADAEAGQTFGTPYYMSPEQARGDRDIGPTADIYALGATFYHMLTGQPPFPGNSSREVMRMHLEEQPAPPAEIRPELTTGISELVIKMLAKEIPQRYASCDELLDELRAWRSFHILKKGESERGPKNNPTRLEGDPQWRPRPSRGD